MQMLPLHFDLLTKQVSLPIGAGSSTHSGTGSLRSFDRKKTMGPKQH